MRRLYFQIVCVLITVSLLFSSCAKANENPTKNADVSEITTHENNSLSEEAIDDTTESESEETSEQSINKVSVNAVIKKTKKYKGSEVKTETSKKITSKEALLKKLNKELGKKNFSERANNMLRDVLDRLYMYYPEWQHVFKDMPLADDYIRQNFIGAIKYINSMNVIDADSPEGKEALDNGSALAYVVEDNDLTLYFKKGKDFYDDNLERLYHEITHCRQQMIFDDSYFEGNEMFRETIVEGGATFHMKFVRENISEMGGGGVIDKGDNSETSLDYYNNNGEGYPFQRNMYEHLIYMAGFDCIHKMEMKKISISDVKKQIGKNYGNETADKVWKELKYFLKLYGEDTKNENKLFNEAIKIQKIFLNFVKTDIENLNTKKPAQVRKFMNVYRSYKLRMLAKWQERIGSRLVVISDEKFNIDYYDNLMIQKIIDSGVVHFSSDSSLNRMAVKALIFASNEYFYSVETQMGDCIPEDLETAKYTYKEYKNSGELIITDKSNRIKIPFNRTKIIIEDINAV